jgi:hypothetical protein
VDREQALREFETYFDEYGEGELLYLPSDLLAEIRSSDLPAEIPVGAVTHRDDRVEVTWDGHLIRAEDGTFRAVIRFQILPKYWLEAIGARFYLDLLHKSVLSAASGIEDLKVEDLDDSDDNVIELDYSFPVSGANLGELYTKARQVQHDLERPAETVLYDVTKAVAKSADRVLRGHYARASELVARVEAAESSADKGASLEILMAALFEQIPGFTVIRSVRTETEQIDLEILNDSQDAVYSKDAPLVLVECKNWTDRPGRPEFSSLETKILNRGRRCTLGFFVSWSGFAGTVPLEQLRLSRGSYIIVCLTGADIGRAALAGNFPEFLRQATLDTSNI